MREASGSLISALANNAVFLVANCYTITLSAAMGGTVYRWTSCDTNLTVGGRTFTSASDQSTSQPGIKRGPIRHARGKEVQTCEITLSSGQTVQMGGISLPLFAHNGGFDCAQVLVELIYMGPSGWGDTSLGTVVGFQGNVAAVTPTTTTVVLEVKDFKELLIKQMPITVFQSSCSNAFGDANCGKSLAALTVASSISSAPSTTGFTASGLAQATGYFNLGTLTMTSGASSGATRAISTFTSGGVIVLVTPLPAAPANSDTFTITPGCDKQFATCGTKYANSTRYRGEPWVPPPETTVTG
jgi:uncharacterized phage protein (TIGR02218 family)